MSAWRAAGINYVRFSQIAAQITRQCANQSAKGAKKAADPTLKISKWENGKQVKN